MADTEISLVSLRKWNKNNAGDVLTDDQLRDLKAWIDTVFLSALANQIDNLSLEYGDQTVPWATAKINLGLS